MMEEQAKVDTLISSGIKSGDAAAFKLAVNNFADLCRSTFDQVEDHIRPVMRRYVAGPQQVKIMKDCWDDAPVHGWWEAIPAVVQNLPMQGQRTTFLRAFLWAMPERCQQIGTIVALGTDPVTWYRIKHQMPEIIPRGESGWKKY